VVEDLGGRAPASQPVFQEQQGDFEVIEVRTRGITHVVEHRARARPGSQSGERQLAYLVCHFRCYSGLAHINKDRSDPLHDASGVRFVLCDQARQSALRPSFDFDLDLFYERGQFVQEAMHVRHRTRIPRRRPGDWTSAIVHA
jgi:hypothetical protein